MTSGSRVVNMNEVSAWFDLSDRSTLDTKGIEQIVTRAEAQTEVRITVALPCEGDGRKLNPLALAL